MNMHDPTECLRRGYRYNHSLERICYSYLPSRCRNVLTTDGDGDASAWMLRKSEYNAQTVPSLAVVACSSWREQKTRNKIRICFNLFMYRFIFSLSVSVSLLALLALRGPSVSALQRATVTQSALSRAIVYVKINKKKQYTSNCVTPRTHAHRRAFIKSENKIKSNEKIETKLQRRVETYALCAPTIRIILLYSVGFAVSLTMYTYIQPIDR